MAEALTQRLLNGAAAGPAARRCRCRSGAPLPRPARPPHRRGGAAAAAERRDPPAPWALTFDLRERETEWTEANQARLVGMAAAQELGMPWPEMESRLDALAALLPDIGGRLAALRPALVAPLVRDLPQLPGRLIALRELLPGVDISALAAGAPQVLLRSEGQLRGAVAELKALLGLDDRQVARLVGETWLYLETECVAEVVDTLRHLLPNRAPRELLLEDPNWLLRAQRGQRWLGEHPDSTQESMYWDSGSND